jgi:hypothetical protein
MNRDIIGHIVYDFQDKEMMERFRPSLGNTKTVLCCVMICCVMICCVMGCYGMFSNVIKCCSMCCYAILCSIVL